MAVLKCRECKGKVSSEAAICPHCGVANPGHVMSKSAPAAAKPKSRIGILVLGGLGLAIAANMILRPPGSSTSASAAASKPAPVINRAADDACRDKGSNIASAYFSSVGQGLQAGVFPSEMMNKGCQQAVGSQGAECVALCGDGFRYEAKKFVKGQ